MHVLLTVTVPDSFRTNNEVSTSLPKVSQLSQDSGDQVYLDQIYHTCDVTLTLYSFQQLVSCDSFPLSWGYSLRISLTSAQALQSYFSNSKSSSKGGKNKEMG